MYQAEWIDNGRFIIRDKEYGYTLCRLDFGLDMSDQLSSELMQHIADDIKDLIIKRMHLQDEKNDTPI